MARGGTRRPQRPAQSAVGLVLMVVVVLGASCGRSTGALDEEPGGAGSGASSGAGGNAGTGDGTGALGGDAGHTSGSGGVGGSGAETGGVGGTDCGAAAGAGGSARGGEGGSLVGTAGASNGWSGTGGFGGQCPGEQPPELQFVEFGSRALSASGGSAGLLAWARDGAPGNLSARQRSSTGWGDATQIIEFDERQRLSPIEAQVNENGRALIVYRLEDLDDLGNVTAARLFVVAGRSGTWGVPELLSEGSSPAFRVQGLCLESQSVVYLENNTESLIFTAIGDQAFGPPLALPRAAMSQGVLALEPGGRGVLAGLAKTDRGVELLVRVRAVSGAVGPEDPAVIVPESMDTSWWLWPGPDGSVWFGLTSENTSPQEIRMFRYTRDAGLLGYGSVATNAQPFSPRVYPSMHFDEHGAAALLVSSCYGDQNEGAGTAIARFESCGAVAQWVPTDARGCFRGTAAWTGNLTEIVIAGTSYISNGLNPPLQSFLTALVTPSATPTILRCGPGYPPELVGLVPHGNGQGSIIWLQGSEIRVHRIPT